MKILLNTIIVVSSCFSICAQDSATQIAVIGCHSQHSPAPVLPYLAEKVKPAYCVWVGDNVYADSETDPQNILTQLQIMDAKPGFNALREQSKFMVTWDDHDFGLNDAGRKYKFREESKQIHRKFWRLENEIPEKQDGVYYSVIEQQPNGKRIQFILLDGRYNRDNPGRRADALGENQWKWLEAQLKQEADLRFIVSGYQVLLQRPTKWEAWVKLGKSRNRLYELINTTKAKGVLFITGDQHYVEVLQTRGVLEYDAYEIMASGINQTEKPGKPGNRVAGPDLTVHNAPVITVYWDGKDGVPPHIYFHVTDVESGKQTLEYRIAFSAIGL